MVTCKKADDLTNDQMLRHVLGCIDKQSASEITLYRCFYPYALSVCNAYATSYEDATEIINDGFMKVFKNINRFCPTHANVKATFARWLRQIMINSAIDHYRRYRKYSDVSICQDQENITAVNDVNGIAVLRQKEMMRSVEKLNEPYRTIFRMRLIDGQSHSEIAQQLDISIATSKSRMFKARMQMQAILSKTDNYCQL
jgi:RNA polymerase sigma factor (sigma-70 family)